MIHEELRNGNKKLAVIGLGYVGLPIALEFAKSIPVLGYDISEERIEVMRNGKDPSNELDHTAFENVNICFTSDKNDLKDASFYIIAVPTPVDSHKVPDLRALMQASREVGEALNAGDYVVYESTVYPGCTEDDCLPILEEMSGLKCPSDFKIGFSPERINPGDTEHTISKILKVVSGIDEESMEEIAKVYGVVVKAGVFKASSIKVAEAAKVIENTQRDLNIALMNELSQIFDMMGINTFDVLEAAGTKWNFLKFTPGLVGGHCIGVDPYYLTYKAIGLGYKPQVILSGRSINDGMGAYVAKKLVQKLIKQDKQIARSKVLVMGATFKENVSDIRNSKVVDVIDELRSYMVDVDVVDPHACKAEMKREYGIEMTEKTANDYDAVVVAVNHKEYQDLDENYFSGIMRERGILVDVKGIYKNRFKKLNYWSL